MIGEELKEHIERHHNNNQSDFARSQGVSQSQARRWLADALLKELAK